MNCLDKYSSTNFSMKIPFYFWQSLNFGQLEWEIIGVLDMGQVLSKVNGICYCIIPSCNSSVTISWKLPWGWRDVIALKPPKADVPPVGN